jgi:hypothetical protein
MYSPALEALEGTNHLQRFDGSFARGNVFKGTPNPDIDAAWEGITYQNGRHHQSDGKAVSKHHYLRHSSSLKTNALRRRHKHLRRNLARD